MEERISRLRMLRASPFSLGQEFGIIRSQLKPRVHFSSVPAGFPLLQLLNSCLLPSAF
jgi:hypothetical protein